MDKSLKQHWIGWDNTYQQIETFAQTTERPDLKAHGAEKLEFNAVHEYFEHRATQKSGYAGARAKVSNNQRKNYMIA